MEVVDRMHAGLRQEGWCMSGDAEAFSECEVIH